MIFRKATKKDVLEIVRMIADDELGKKIVFVFLVFLTLNSYSQNNHEAFNKHEIIKPHG